MDEREDFLALDDKALLGECDVNICKSSGPGGQHRNKVSSAVRLRHRPTGITATGDDSRSQHDNKRMAIRRMRMNIACRLRRPVRIENPSVPPVVADCIFVVRGGQNKGVRRLEIGRKDVRFWQVAAFLLDVLEAFQSRLSFAARYVGITTSNFVSLMQSDRHLLAAAQQIRKRNERKPIS